jgi:outer membrane protein OmpA-like peptidoglycan-associated protein
MRYRALPFIVVVTILLTDCAFGQDFKDALDRGDRAYKRQDYGNALMYYKQAKDFQPSAASVDLKIGLTYVSTTSFKFKALPYLKKAFELEPRIDADIDYYLGLAYQVNHQFVEAQAHYEKFKTQYRRMSALAQHKIEECIRGDSLVRNPTEAIIENLGRVVNSPYHDYAPLIYPDGQTMIFTSNRGLPKKLDKYAPEVNYEDIYSTRKLNGKWSPPSEISSELNVERHDAGASISHDGKYLFIYYEEGNGDLFISENVNGKWQKATALNENVNTINWETSACMSADGRKLYFSSDRAGGYGDLDIWVSEKDASGDWGIPRNLGPNVNTSGNEDSPFIHTDGKTLYFGSDAHSGLGSTDIFKSEFEDGKWQPPTNMGYPVNTADYDNYFVISNDKKHAYFASVREDGFGETDIYYITFLDPKPKVEIVVAPPVLVDEPANKDFVDPIVQLQKDLQIGTILKGKVIDAFSASPLGARMTLTDNEKNKILAVINSDPVTGDFEMFIPHGGNYGVSTEMEGYLFNSINFNVPAFTDLREIDTHIIMVKVEKGSKVVLKNIFFDTGKSDLKQESVSELENIRKLLDGNPNLIVQINGHTDNVGEATYNRALSQKRASSVVDYLVRNGVESNRLAAVGFGEERPLVSNDDELGGREINRRTEIEIIETDHSN